MEECMKELQSKLDSLAEMTRDELRIEARSLGLFVSGTKGELLNRVHDFIQSEIDSIKPDPVQKKDLGGRPPIGETKKVSLTLDPIFWDRLDSDAKHVGGRSAFLRDLIESYYYMRDQERQIAVDLYGEDSVL